MKENNDVVEDIMQQHGRLQPAAEALRKKLNGIIAEYELSSENVLFILARLCAGYIHQTQKVMDHAGVDNPSVINDVFQDMLTAYLTHYDMSDVGADIDKMIKGEVN